MTVPPACWICGETVRRSFSLRGKNVFLCLSCGLAHRWPLPKAEETEENLRGQNSPFSVNLENQRSNKKSLQQWQLDKIQEFVPRGKLLDVGCGYGFFLDMARRSGWDVRGLELSAPDFQHAKNSLDLPVQNLSLRAAAFPENSFDVVTLWEVADYMPDLWDQLGEIFRLLKPGGWVWMRSYNSDFHLPVLRAFAHAPLRWLGMKPGVLHLYGLNPGCMIQAFQQKGFQNIHIFPSPMTPGDPHGQGGALGSWGVRIGKSFVRISSQLVYGLTGKVFSSAFVARAQKPVSQRKVMHIVTRLDTGGSAENVVYSANKVSPQRYWSLLVSGQTDHPTHVLRRPPLTLPALQREIDLWADMRAFWALVRLIRTLKPDIVHTHSSKAGLLGRWAAYLAGTPRLVHTAHGHVFYGYFPAWKSRLYAWLEKITARITHRHFALPSGDKK